MEPNEPHPSVRVMVEELTESVIRGTCGHGPELTRLRAENARLTAERDEATRIAREFHNAASAIERERDAAIQRAERAERVVAEALRRRAHTFEMDGTAMMSIQSADHRWQINVAFDGIDADLCRALVEACEGGRDGKVGS